MERSAMTKALILDPRNPSYNLASSGYSEKDQVVFERPLRKDEYFFLGAFRYKGDVIIDTQRIMSFVEIFERPKRDAAFPKFSLILSNLQVNGKKSEKLDVGGMVFGEVPQIAEAFPLASLDNVGEITAGLPKSIDVKHAIVIKIGRVNKTRFYPLILGGEPLSKKKIELNNQLPK
jgi:hypothetical protein